MLSFLGLKLSTLGSLQSCPLGGLLGVERGSDEVGISVRLDTSNGVNGPASLSQLKERRGKVELSLYYNLNPTNLFFLWEVPIHPHQAAFLKVGTAGTEFALQNVEPWGVFLGQGFSANSLVLLLGTRGHSLYIPARKGHL